MSVEIYRKTSGGISLNTAEKGKNGQTLEYVNKKWYLNDDVFNSNSEKCKRYQD